VALEVFYFAGVYQLGQGGVKRHFRQQGQAVAGGGLLGLALAEEINFLAAVGAGGVAAG